MDTSEVTIATLAKERINLLDLKLLDNRGNMFASIEYQYKPKDAPRTWHKVVIPILKNENTLGTIIESVRESRAELEK